MIFHFTLLLVAVIGNLFEFPGSDVATGVLDEAALKRAIPGVEWATMDDRISVVAPRSDAEERLGPILRVLYPRRAWGSEESGAQYLVKLPPAKEYARARCPSPTTG